MFESALKCLKLEHKLCYNSLKHCAYKQNNDSKENLPHATHFLLLISSVFL